MKNDLWRIFFCFPFLGEGEAGDGLAFEASSLTINPTAVKPGEKVGIFLRITNYGDVTGVYKVVLQINKVVEDSKDVTLDGGVSTVVIFATSHYLSGNYHVEVAGLNDNFTIPKSVTLGLWFWLTAVGAFILGIILVTGFVMLRNKKR
jgi:hypothetical protein